MVLIRSNHSAHRSTVDSQRRQYEIKESSVLRTPPDVDWVEDRSTRKSVNLSSAVARSSGQQAARDEARKVADANAAETKKMEKDLLSPPTCFPSPRVTMSVSDSKVTQKSVQNTVFEPIGAGASTSRSHHKDLDFNALCAHVM